MTHTINLKQLCSIPFLFFILGIISAQPKRHSAGHSTTPKPTGFTSIQNLPCPVIQFTKSASPSGNFDTLVINNQTTGVPATEIDYCAGDLEQTPILQSQSSGSPAIANASQIIPVNTGDKYIGFIPAPSANNSTCFFKANLGTDLNSDAITYSSGLGTLQNRFPNPLFLVLTKKDSIWFGFASNGDTKLWRIRFGASLENNAPQISEVVLPANTLASPFGAQIVKSGDTTFLFVLNNNNQVNNNVVRLRFSDSLESTPQVSVLNNPLILQNSSGFLQMSFGNVCGKWFGLLLGNSQLYRLDYGNSLSNTPTAVSLTTSVTSALSSPNAFTNLRGITMLQDMGRWYAFINTSTGNLFRVRFRNGLDQLPDQVTNFGSFSISGTVNKFNFIRQNSEFFGYAINNLGVLYRLKFPNNCPATKSFRVMTNTGRDSTRYLESGKYYLTVSAQSTNGKTSQTLDSVNVVLNSSAGACTSVSLSHPEITCSDYSTQASINFSQQINAPKWDFCTGDFKTPPSRLTQPVALGYLVLGHQILESNGIYYAFSINNAGFVRTSLGTDPSSTPSSTTLIALPQGGTLFSNPADFVIFKDNNNWFAFVVYTTGEILVRLNFGPDITNATPGFSLISIPGQLASPRGITLFEDFRGKYGIISNQTSGSITVLNFGQTYLNIPISTKIDIPGSVNPFKVSMVRDCQTWNAFVSDLAKDSVFQLRFRNGLNRPPSVRKLPVLFARGVRAVKDGNEYFLFVTKSQPNRNNLFRFSFGSSLENEPKVDSLGNFQGTAPNSGLTNVSAFQLYQTEKSQYYFFGAGEAGQFYRLSFQNPCSAEKPIVTERNVNNQIYRTDGKFYFSFSGWDNAGNSVSGFDSITVQNLVDVDFIVPGTRCKGEPIQFNDASTTSPFTSVSSWSWDFGDSLAVMPDTSAEANPTYTFNRSGTYAVRLRVREQGGCINQVTRNVVIADKPRPNFSVGNGGILCTNDSILFTDLSTSNNDPITQRTWEIRQNGNLIASSTKANPRFLFNQTGTYQVKLIVRGESLCDSTLIRNIQVGGQGPLVSFTNPSACLGEIVTFVPSITGTNPDSVRWFVDAARFNVSGNFGYAFTSASLFTVRLVAYKGQCANSSLKIINVNTKPIVGTNVQASLFCQGLPFNFSGSIDVNQPVKYLWNFGDGTSDTLQNPTKIFSDSGNFSVRLRVTTVNGCFTEDTLKVRAKRAPKAMFSFDKACKDEPVTFTNQSTANGIAGGITSFLWEFGTVDNQISNLPNPGPVLYNEPPGIKTVKLTVRTAEDCPNTITRNIAIGPKLAANFRKETGCIGTPFRFFDLTNPGSDSIVSWQWSIGGLNYNIKNPVVEFDQIGTYDVKLIVKSGSGCTDEVTRSQEVTVLNAATADFSIGGTNFSEPPFQVLFRQVPDVNPSYNYTWDFGDSTSSIAPNPPTHFYQQEGTYVVTMTATRAGTICSTKIQKVVNVITNPLQGVKIRKIITAKGTENISVGVEAENQSNVALRSLDFIVEAGKWLSLRESWNGILLPGAILRFDFKSAIQYQNSQRIPYLCALARLSDPSKETSPEDNYLCAQLDSISSFVSLFPNPSSENFTADLSLATTDPIELRVTNAMGKEIYRLDELSPAAGRFRTVISTLNWPTGLYQVIFRSGSVAEVRKLVVSKN
jgi:PKD repeat protein